MMKIVFFENDKYFEFWHTILIRLDVYATPASEVNKAGKYNILKAATPLNTWLELAANTILLNWGKWDKTQMWNDYLYKYTNYK